MDSGLQAHDDPFALVRVLPLSELERIDSIIREALERGLSADEIMRRIRAHG